MHFSYTVLLWFGLTGAIVWLNYRLLARLFSFFRNRLISYPYLFLTVTSIIILGYGWTRRPPLLVPDFEGYHLLVYGALAWLVGQFVLLIFQPFLYVIHRLLRKKRRVFLNCALGAAIIFAFGICITGIYNAQTAMTVQRYFIVTPELPQNLKGFKIAQISDTHLGPFFDLAKLDIVIQLLKQEKPDLVVITGDFADDLTLLRPAIEKLNELAPSIPYGIYFCDGNHDYFQNIELVRIELKNSRITLLENSSKLILAGPKPFFLMGVDYPWANATTRGSNVSASRRQQYFTKANANVPANAFKVLIAHHPDALADGFAAQIPLTISGHTHGGQVVVAGKSLLSQYRYMRGLYQENGVYGYVSSGTGHWFPLRIGCPAEISVFTLE